mmetsp:Transcript_21110/g.54495  ORF Transcript_21110/g.54495 Transcript_21110/m.54495 type:complete len:203 (+) Transcript_21110:544-1152(+)
MDLELILACRRTEGQKRTRTTVLAAAEQPSSSTSRARCRGRVITTLALFSQFYVAVRLTPRRTSWRQLINPVPYPAERTGRVRARTVNGRRCKQPPFRLPFRCYQNAAEAASSNNRVLDYSPRPPACREPASPRFREIALSSSSARASALANNATNHGHITLRGVLGPPRLMLQSLRLRANRRLASAQLPGHDPTHVRVGHV